MASEESLRGERLQALSRNTEATPSSPRPSARPYLATARTRSRIKRRQRPKALARLGDAPRDRIPTPEARVPGRERGTGWSGLCLPNVWGMSRRGIRSHRGAKRRGKRIYEVSSMRLLASLRTQAATIIAESMWRHYTTRTKIESTPLRCGPNDPRIDRRGRPVVRDTSTTTDMTISIYSGSNCSTQQRGTDDRDSVSPRLPSWLASLRLAYAKWQACSREKRDDRIQDGQLICRRTVRIWSRTWCYAKP